MSTAIRRRDEFRLVFAGFDGFTTDVELNGIGQIGSMANVPVAALQ